MASFNISLKSCNPTWHAYALHAAVGSHHSQPSYQDLCFTFALEGILQHGCKCLSVQLGEESLMCHSSALVV